MFPSCASGLRRSSPSCAPRQPGCGPCAHDGRVIRGRRARSQGAGRAQSPHISRVIWIWMENHAATTPSSARRRRPSQTALRLHCGLRTITATSRCRLSRTSSPRPPAAPRASPATVSRRPAAPRTNLFDQARAAHISWASYQESIPADAISTQAAKAAEQEDYALRPATHAGLAHARERPATSASSPWELRLGRVGARPPEATRPARLQLRHPESLQRHARLPRLEWRSLALALWMGAIVSRRLPSRTHRRLRGTREAGSSDNCTTNTGSPSCAV